MHCSSPLISVVMSVYNGADNLAKSIDSILNQSFKDFEFIIINDGSTDDSRKILDDYSQRDSRIKVFHQQNQGLTCSLIDGCKLARGKYLARMDAGDFSYPLRFEKQVNLLESNTNLGMVYSGAEFYGPYGELLYVESRSNDPVIAHQQLQHEKLGPPGHPTVMMRKSIYDQLGGYRKEFYYSQDSDLWLRIAEISQVCSTMEYLLQIHIDLNGISARKKVIQYQFADLAHEAKNLRLSGQSDQSVLKRAAALIEKMKSANAISENRNSEKNKAIAAHCYFLGSLADKKYPHISHRYFTMAIKHDFYNFKYLLKWLINSLQISFKKNTTAN